MSRRLIASCILFGLIFSRNAKAQETPAPLPAPSSEPSPAAAPPAPPAAVLTPNPTPAPSAGHVYVPKLAPRVKSKGDAATAEASDAQPANDPQAKAADDDAEPTSGPVNGFMMEGRLTQSIATEGATNSLFGGSPGAPPIVTIGYRTDRVGVLFGPSISHYGSDSGIGSTTIGLSFHLEITVARTDDRINEGYIVGAVSLANTSFNSDALPGGTLPSALAGSVALGFGARHWATRHLAFGVELGEGYSATGSLNATPRSYEIVRSTALDTCGAITTAVVF